MPTSFTDALAVACARPPRCTVAKIAAALDPADQKALTEALGSELEASKITAALKAMGHDLGAAAVSRHRRGVCACGHG